MRPKSWLLKVWLILGLILLAACAAWAQSPNLQTLLRSGQAALDSDDYARAATAFERARQAAPDNLQANRGLVVSYLQLGRLNEATQLGKEAAIRWPRDAQLQHWLGLAYFKAGEIPAAQAALQTSEALDGTRADIHFDLALVLLQQNQSGPAADELEKAVKLQPSLAMAHLLLGRAYQNTNRTMQAVEQFQTALRADPNALLGHYHLAFAYASLGGTRRPSPNTKKNSRVRRTILRCSTSLVIACWRPERWRRRSASWKRRLEIDPRMQVSPTTSVKLCFWQAMAMPL